MPNFRTAVLIGLIGGVLGFALMVTLRVTGAGLPGPAAVGGVVGGVCGVLAALTLKSRRPQA